MKLAISGKGGVGKTTISALISSALHASGHDVLAIDADPDANLLACMGHPDTGSVRPLVELKGLIEERTGVKPGTTGGMFKLNPKVDDIPEKYGVDIGGIKVLVAGAVKKGGSGCYCPENAFVRNLVSHLLLDKQTTLVLDMEAGIEHLGRGTVGAVDQLLVVANPGRRSIETAVRIKTLAGDIGLNQVSVVANKVRSEEDKEYLARALPDMPLIGAVPYDESVLVSEREGTGLAGISEDVLSSVNEIVKYLKK